MPALVFVLSFCSVSYQVLFSYIIADVSEHSRVFVYSFTAGVYFLSLGLGAYIYNKFYSEHKINLLIKVESLLVLAAPLSVFGIYCLSIVFSLVFVDWVSAQWGLFYYTNILLVLCAQVFVFVIGVLSGFELPVFLKSSSQTGFVVFFNYIAGLFAGVFLPIFLIPNLDFFGTLLLITYCNIFALIYLTYSYYKTIYTRYSLVVLFLSIIIFISTAYKDQFFNFYLKTRYFNVTLSKKNSILDMKNILNKISVIDHFRTQYQSVDIISPYITKEFPDIFKTFTVFLDQKPQINLLDWRLYHESMVEGSINLFKKKPKNILVLGAGDGLIISQILKFIPDCEKIDWVELDAKVIQFFKHLTPLNLITKQAFSSSKVNLYIDDAFHFIKNTKTKYDAIFIDFPFPFNQDLSRLYSLEFYKLLKKRLLKEAYIVADVLVVTKKEYVFPDDFILPQSIVASTLKAAGFKSLFFYGKAEPFLFAQVTKKLLSFDHQGLSKKITIGTQKNLKELSAQYLNLKIRPEYINSIFKPLSFIP